MHYSPLNAVAAASPASASPSSSHSALSPVASNSLNHLSYHQSSHLSANEHVHHHHSLSHDDLMAHAHMSDSMSSVNSPVAPFSNGNSSNNNNSVSNTPTKQEMCDDLATYTTLTSVNNTQLNHYPEQGSQAHQMAQQTNNGPKGANKRTTTATKSSYNGKSNSSATANGNASNGSATPTGRQTPGGGKKTKGRVKIKMEFIDNKLRRYTTFSKRKTGIMKKAYELSTLTGTQVMLLVASETGHVYTFATRKLQPMITSDAGKALIQTCLNSPDLSGGLMNGTGGNQQSTNSSSAGPEVVTTNGHVSSLLGGSNNTSSGLSNHTIVNTVPDHSDMSRMVLTNGSAGPGSISGCSTPNTVVDQRMSATGFEETELSYSVNGEECSPLNDKGIFSGCLTIGTNSLVNSLPSGPSNNGMARSKSSMPCSSTSNSFFINETPGLGSEEDDDDEEEEEEEEEDEDEEPEGEDEDELDDMSYLSGLHLDSDLTRLIGNSSAGNNPILVNDLLWGATSQPAPPAAPSPSKSGSTSGGCNNSGFVSDRTKLNLNLKLQQKQQMQQSQQHNQPQRTQQVRSQGQGFGPQHRANQVSTQFNLNMPQSSNTTKTGSNRSNKSSTVSLNTPNSKNSRKTQMNTSKSKTLTPTSSTSLSSSSNSLNPLGLVSGGGGLNQAQFVNFDPASFLDSCFNTSTTGNQSPESGSFLDSHHNLDHILMNNGELLLLNSQGSSNQLQQSTSDQFNLMMMIGGGGGNQLGQSTNVFNQFGTQTGPNNKNSMVNKSQLNSNKSSANQRVTQSKSNDMNTNLIAQLAPHNSSHLYQSSPSRTLPQSSFPSAFHPSKQVSLSPSSAVLNTASHSPLLNAQANNFITSTGKQSSISSQTSTGNKQHHQLQQQQQQQQSHQQCATSSSSTQSIKAANLNAIINNLAATTSSTSSASQNINNHDNTRQSGTGANSTGTNNNLNQFGAMAAAAQQLLSGNIILCTTPSPTISLDPSVGVSGGTVCPVTTTTTSNTTNHGPTQTLFSLGATGTQSTSPDTSSSSPSSTTLLFSPTNLQNSGLSIQSSGGQAVGIHSNQASNQNSLGTSQLIYNAFSGLAGRILYQTPSTTSSITTSNASGSHTSTSDGPQTFSTLITADGQQFVFNVSPNGNGIAQLVTGNPNDSSSANTHNNNTRQIRIKQECMTDSNGSIISLMQPSGTLLQDLQHSISIDSLLGGNGLQQNPIITTFQPTLVSTTTSGNIYATPKPLSSCPGGPGSKKQRTK